jgi:hypothetical protein
MKSCISALVSGLLFFGCVVNRPTAGVSDTLLAKELMPYGRTLTSEKDGVELISSAAHFGFTFEGQECRLYVTLSTAQSHNYLQYELDNVYQKRLRVANGSAGPIVISAAAGGKHTVWIYKATEAHTGPIFIQKIAGTKVRPVARPSLPLIEFIGNSITCGAAADPSEVACGKGVYHDQHNAYYAYGPRTARALNLNYILSSVSGIGIYRNWNNDGPAMPQVFGKSDFQNTGSRNWNFGRYQPQIVSVALGTNDFSNGDGKKARLPFDSSAFVSAYIKFVQQVKANYPAAKIALLSSPMINGERRTLLQNCLSAVKAAIDRTYPSANPVALYFFKPMQARGCSGHPNVEDHSILADELIPFFRTLLQQ